MNLSIFLLDLRSQFLNKFQHLFFPFVENRFFIFALFITIQAPHNGSPEGPTFGVRFGASLNTFQSLRSKVDSLTQLLGSPRNAIRWCVHRNELRLLTFWLEIESLLQLGHYCLLRLEVIIGAFPHLFQVIVIILIVRIIILLTKFNTHQAL